MNRLVFPLDFFGMFFHYCSLILKTLMDESTTFTTEIADVENHLKQFWKRFEEKKNNADVHQSQKVHI